MKNNITAMIAAATMFAAPITVLAGPYRSAIVRGGNEEAHLMIDVPKGKAIAITNFADTLPDISKSIVGVNINGEIAVILQAVLASQNSTEGQPNNREVIVVGPATVSVNTSVGQIAFISYRIFAN